MKVIKYIKIVKKSKVLTEQEKKELIKKGIVEMILNIHKDLCKLPFAIIGIVFCLFSILFSKLGEIMELLETPFKCIVLRIDDWEEIVLTKGETRDKLLKEIKENGTTKIIKADVKNAFKK